MFSIYDISYDTFNELIKDFAKELNYNFNDFSINKKEFSTYGLFIYYKAEYHKNENHLSLLIEIDKDIIKNYVKEMKYSLDLGFYDTPVIFHFYHKMNDKNSPCVLDRWLSNSLKKVNEYKRTPFDYYFSDLPYLNYGKEGISDTTAYLFKVALFGILNSNNVNKIWIARIRHISKGDLYRSFSYAILPSGKMDWLIFPDSVGLDSGGARRGYMLIEDSIEEAKKIGEIEIIDIDASLEEFEKRFKYLHTEYIETHFTDRHYLTHFTDGLYFRLNRMNKDGVELIEFLKVAQRIDNEIENKEYMLVLREMRALIQGLCKHICKTKNIPLESNPNINQLSGALLKNEVIDPHIKVWFEAFHSIANEAAHDVDSSKVFDMDSKIRGDLFTTTIKLGEHLIIQLFSKV